MRYRPRLAWIRYGSHDLTDEEIQEAAGKFRVAIIQPWELKAAETLKELDSDVIVLAYQCLSSERADLQFRYFPRTGRAPRILCP